MQPVREFELVERNLRTAMSFFARSDPNGEAVEADGVTLIACGRNYPLFNLALLNGTVAGEGVLVSRIKTAAKFFGDRGQGWSCWVCEDLLDPKTRVRCRSIFQERGLHSLSEPPGMLARRLLPPMRPLPAMEFRRVDDTSTRLAFCHLTAIAFELPFPMTRNVYDCASAWRNDFVGYLGYVQGQAVSSAVVSPCGGVAGLYSIATMPDFQRRGCGEAIVRYVLEETRKETGIEASVLESSRAGLRLYSRLGFEIVTQFAVYRSNLG